MQNFTFGRKGLNWFLFAFILFVGNLASYGQDCATPDPDQSYCYLQTVNDIRSSDGTNTAIYETSNSETDTDPLNPDELLTNGTTYYIGSTTEDCDRVAVTVAVNAAPTPTNTVTNSQEGFTISPCESSEFSGTDLLGLFNSNDDYTLKIYETQFGDSEIVDYDETLVDGNSYFIGFSPNNSDDCPSARVAVGIDVVDSPAPTATSPQTFCEGATVADLMASSDEENFQAFRWYRNSEGGSPLADDVELIDGEDYFVSQIVNERSSIFPPCESERTEVQVTLVTANAGTSNSETLCLNDVEDQGIFDSVESLEDYFLSLLGTEDATGSFSNETLATLRTNYLNGIDGASEDFTTTYEVDNGFCPVVSATATLTVTAPITADAGTAVTNPPYCSGDAPIILSDIITGGNPSGVFSSPDADVSDGTLDPSGLGGQTISITYTVSPETACVTDTATEDFEITINETPNAGPGGEFSFCQAEFEEIVTEILANPFGKGAELLSELGDDIDTGGDFSDDDLATLIMKYNTATFPETFNTTYTVEKGGCTSKATYSITITPNEPVSAGGDQNQDPVCTTDGVQNLNDYLGTGATSGGEFTSSDVTITDGMFFDPSAETAGTGYTVTYSVDGDDDICLTGSEEAIITFDIIEGIDAGEPIEDTICVEEVADDFFTEGELTDYLIGLLDDGVPTTGSFNPDVNQLIVDYNGGATELKTVYTLDDEPCNDSVEITLIIKDNIEASLTEVDDPEPICENAGIQDLTDFIESNPTYGRFEGYPEGEFDPGAEGEGVYTIEYTVDEEIACVTGTATISFDITVQASAYAGNGDSFELCTEQESEDLFARLSTLNDNADTDGSFSYLGETLDMGMFDPSEYPAGEYEVVYTVASINDCGTDEASFFITVAETPEAGEGNTEAQEVCGNLDTFDLYTLLDTDADDDGEFTVNGNADIDGQIQPTDLTPDNYTIEYTVNSGEDDACTDTATFSLTITDAADAGEAMTVEACTNDAEINLFMDGISEGADDTGEFTFKDSGEVIENGMLDPSGLDAIDYTIVYTVSAINDCGEDSVELTVEVSEAPDGPTVEGNPFTFCAVDGATVADLSATGSNLTYYSDAELTTMVMAEDALATGSYYVTQRNDDGACESAAAEITVTVNDAATPTISNTTQEFCEYDDATIADLTDEVNETGNITWYDSADGDNALNGGTPLQDGIVYYATLFDVDSGCESSVRLAVTVEITDCPLLFPEGFSPNGDGINDTFDIENIEFEYPNYTIEIYNRWGDSVYKGNASTPEWDGFSSDSSLGDDVLPVGAYFYYLDFNDGSTEPIRGTVYLSR